MGGEDSWLDYTTNNEKIYGSSEDNETMIKSMIKISKKPPIGNLTKVKRTNQSPSKILCENAETERSLWSIIIIMDEIDTRMHNWESSLWKVPFRGCQGFRRVKKAEDEEAWSRILSMMAVKTVGQETRRRGNLNKVADHQV